MQCELLITIHFCLLLKRFRMSYVTISVCVVACRGPVIFHLFGRVCTILKCPIAAIQRNRALGFSDELLLFFKIKKKTGRDRIFTHFRSLNSVCCSASDSPASKINLAKAKFARDPELKLETDGGKAGMFAGGAPIAAQRATRGFGRG